MIVRSAYPMWKVKLMVIEIKVNLSIGEINSCLLLSKMSETMFLHLLFDAGLTLLKSFA